jgi:acetyl-CoA C-acetyltransferase
MAQSIRDQVAVIGVGCTKFGDRFDQSYEDLAVEATFAALTDAAIDPERIEAAWLGTYSPYGGNGKGAVSLADSLRLYGKPITRVENFCATGTDALRNACMAVAAGVYDVVLVLGVEKLKDRPNRGLAREGVHPYQGDGLTAPGMFAMSANRYFHRFGGGRDSLAKVAVKNHSNGALNPKAHLRIKVTEEQVLNAPMISYPFGLYDCCPTTDGAAAAIISRAEIARQFRSDYVLVKGLGMAVTSGRPWFDAENEGIGFGATRAAAAEAYRMAGIHEPAKEIDLAEVHDCFTWTEITNYEDLGFCGKGEGIRFIGEGRSSLQGDLPVNPSGGLKSFGHPIGASGLRMIYEVVMQLRGGGGERQVKDAHLGLAHNLGGPGAVSCVIILGQP